MCEEGQDSKKGKSPSGGKEKANSANDSEKLALDQLLERAGLLNADSDIEILKLEINNLKLLIQQKNEELNSMKSHQELIDN